MAQISPAKKDQICMIIIAIGIVITIIAFAGGGGDFR